LDKKYIELDAIIEKSAKKTIADIFREDGEIRFRELEIEVVKQAAAQKNAVIACGGGIVLNTINIDRLKKESVIVCLEASPAAILKRTSGGGRPLLSVADREQQIKSLLEYRRPFYRRAADITVSTSRLGIEVVAEKIIGLLKDYESNDR
jgi:shikimate kinase